LSFLITVKAIPIQTTKTLPLLSTSTRGTLDEYKKVNPKSVYTPPPLNEKICSEIGGIYENKKCTIIPKNSDNEYSSVERTTINEFTTYDTITTKTLPPRVVSTRSEKTMPTDYKNIYLTISGYIYEYPPKGITVTNMKNICYNRSGEYDPYRKGCKYTIDNTSTRSLPPKIVPTTSTRSLPPKIIPTTSSSLREVSTTKNVFITDLEKHCSKHGAYYNSNDLVCKKYTKTVSIIQYHNMNTKNVPGSYIMSGYRYDYPPKHAMTNMHRFCREKDGEYDYLRGVCRYPITTSSSAIKNTMTVDDSTITSYTDVSSSQYYTTTTKTVPSYLLTYIPIIGERSCTMPNGEVFYGTAKCKSIPRTTRSTTTTTDDIYRVTDKGSSKALPSPFDIKELCKMYDAYYDPVKKTCSKQISETATTFSTMTILTSVFTEEPIQEPTQEPTPFINECAKEWDQCGGLNYDGPNCCPSGFVCEIFNDYYSQCIKEY
jgi:hypothetical protein